MSSFTLKSTASDFQAIILPFTSRWYETIAAGDISIVFRKRGPLCASPKWMYAYFSTPMSAIRARVVIKSITKMPLEEAVEQCEAGGLSEHALRKYAADYNELCVYDIGKVDTASETIGAAFMFDRYKFYPTPNYIALSDEGIREFNGLLGLTG